MAPSNPPTPLGRHGSDSGSPAPTTAAPGTYTLEVCSFTFHISHFTFHGSYIQLHVTLHVTSANDPGGNTRSQDIRR